MPPDHARSPQVAVGLALLEYDTLCSMHDPEEPRTMSGQGHESDRSPPDGQEILVVSRGIATAVAPESGLTDVQIAVLEAITKALADVSVDYRDLDPLGPDELATYSRSTAPSTVSASCTTWTHSSWRSTRISTSLASSERNIQPTSLAHV
jgi:hypothetical protein